MTYSHVLSSYLNCLYCICIWPSWTVNSPAGIYTTDWVLQKVLCALSAGLNLLSVTSNVRKALGASFESTTDSLRLGGEISLAMTQIAFVWTVWFRRDRMTDCLKSIDKYWTGISMDLMPKKITVQLVTVTIVLFNTAFSIWAGLFQAIPSVMDWSLENCWKSHVLEGRFHLMLSFNGHFGAEDVAKVEVTGENIGIALAGGIINIYGSIWTHSVPLMILILVYSLWAAVNHFHRTWVVNGGRNGFHED